MTYRAPSWLREMLQIWVQWLGIAAASILAGILLGVLLKRGISTQMALAVAILVALILSLWFWIIIGRHFHIAERVYSGSSDNRLLLEGVSNQHFAAAGVVVVISLGSFTSLHSAKKPIVNYPIRASNTSTNLYITKAA